jgi:hypothetical protein
MRPLLPCFALSALLLSGCQPSPKVTRWKQVDGEDMTYGLVVEQAGSEVVGELYELLPSDSFSGESLLRRRVSSGIWLTGRYCATGADGPRCSTNGIVLPLMNPRFVGARRWLKGGGPHLVVAWPADGARLSATLHEPGRHKSARVEFEQVLPMSAQAGAPVGGPGQVTPVRGAPPP